MQRDKNAILAVAYKILNQMEPRNIAHHIRTFTDYLVTEFETNQSEVTNHINLLLNMIWDKVR